MAIMIDETGAVLNKPSKKSSPKGFKQLWKKRLVGDVQKFKKEFKPSVSKKGYRSFQRGVARGIRQGAGVSLPAYYQLGTIRRGGKSTRVKRSAGRPRGTFKYSIQGKPVDVFTYRRYMSRMRALQRLQERQMRVPTQTQSFPERPQAVPQTSYPQQRPVGNILNAPNIMKGELVNTTSQQAVKGPDVVTRPVNNARGDYYTDIDPASGKPILRRRIRERWLTNE